MMAAPMRPGVVQWLGLRPARREPMLVVSEVVLSPEAGLVGDRYNSRTNQARQVTIIQSEDLAAIASYLGMDTVPAALVRRNVVVSGINLLALKGQRIRLGTAVLEVTGECQPCSRMEEVLGVGGYNAVRSHGGITARVLQAGAAKVGSRCERLDD